METRGPTRLETLATLRTANVDVALATAFVTLVTGAFLVGYVQLMGGSDLWIGVLSAIPSLAGFFQIPGAIWGRGFPSYKKFITPGGLFWRLFYVPLVFLPLLAIPNTVALAVLLICVSAGAAVINIVNPIYNDWIAELVPADSRGLIFSRRNAIATAVGAIVGIVGGLLLDSFRAQNQERLGFSIIFGLGVACSAASMGFFMRMRDIPRTNPIRSNLGAGVRAIGTPFKDPAFRPVLIFLAGSVFAQSFAGNLFVAFARESLHLGFLVIQGTAISMAVGNVASAAIWGYLSDKLGNKPVLVLVGFLVATNPFAWIACQPGQNGFNAVLLLTTHVLMGVIWCGINLCQFNLMLATAKPEDRANYIGAGLTVIAIVGGVSPLMGAAMMALLRTHFSVEIAYKIVFGTVAVLRFASVFLMIQVREPGSTAVRSALKDLRSVTPRAVMAMRNLTGSADVSRREEAIAELGNEGLTLASSELIQALHDPMPAVRRQAAQSLARLHDPRAVSELIHQLEEHPSLLEEETVRALGDLGFAAAIPSLVGLLENPSSLLRRSAARSLAEVVHQASADQRQKVEVALCHAAEKEDDPDLRRAALQALRMMGSTNAAAVIAPALLDVLPSVRIAAAEAASELASASCAPNLRISLREFPDEASAEVAYALGAMGDPEDIRAILSVAQRSSSVIPRRRALLGLARMLGVETDTYRLMLISGLGRDQAIVEIMRPAIKKRPRLRLALDQFSSGLETQAIITTAKIVKSPTFEAIANSPVEELFLVVAPAARNLILSLASGPESK